MFLVFNLCTVLSFAQRCVRSDNRPVVSLFGHSVVKRLCHWSGRRGELVVRTLGLQSCAEVIAYGQGGLSFKRVLESPGQYLKEMGHPDLLVIDLGSNDLTCVYSTVAEVADDALRFLALVDDDVRPHMIVLLSVIQRTSVSDRVGWPCPHPHSTVGQKHLTPGYRPVFARLPMYACLRNLESISLDILAMTDVTWPRRDRQGISKVCDRQCSNC